MNEYKRTLQTGPYTVQYGTPADLDLWMALVNRVAWNFPGLETQELLDAHRNTVLRFMQKQQALYVKDHERIAGVLLFSRKRNMLCCLAVAPEYRRRGIASLLLQEALSQLKREHEIIVTTFRADDPKGTAPRALYHRFGFTEGRLCEENSYPVQEFILKER